MSTIPNGFKLNRGYNRRLIESDEYEHFTVADLIEVLADYPQDANVWIERNVKRVRPVEAIFGTEGDVFLG